MKTYSGRFLNLWLLFVTLFEFGTSTSEYYTASDGRRYLFEDETNYNWLEALDLCASRQMQLVVIDKPSKNDALVALLKSVYDGTRQLWIGHHDEFGTSKDKGRPFYSAATGGPIYFGYWTSDNPSNDDRKEHCVHTNSDSFRWNDMSCETNFGYICEDHYLTLKHHESMAQKRLAIAEKNIQIVADFESNQKKINQIIDDTRNNTDNIFLGFLSSTTEVIKEFKKSLNDMVLKNPYMQAVVADVGCAINELDLKAQHKINGISDQTRRMIKDLHLNAEKTSHNVNLELATKLSNNKNDIDKLLI